MSEKKKSVYSNIADDILDKIRNNVYPVGSLLPPERELMSVYGVQRTTVRRGLDLLSADGYIKKVAGLGSVVKSASPSASGKASSKISDKAEVLQSCSILLPSKKNLDSMPSFVLNLISGLGKAGVGFMTDKLSDIDKGSGIIALDTNPETDTPVCLALCQSDERRSVIPDNDKGAYIALSYLEELGHTKIAFIGTDNGYSFENAAYDSFNAVNSYPDDELVMLSGSSEKSGFDGFSELFRRHGRKFTAVCAVNDEVAKGIFKAAKYYKINVPKELSVISLCSSNASSDFDCIYYNSDELAEEIIHSAGVSSRISTVLFGGNLLKKGSCAAAFNSEENGKNMSNFLL